MKKNPSRGGLDIGINRNLTKKTNKALLILYAAAQLALATGIPFNKNENIKDDSFRKNLLKNTKEMLQADDTQLQKNKDWPDNNFIYPGNIVLTKNSDSINEQKSITIPYELAPHFDLAQAIDTSDYDAFNDTIVKKLEEVFNQALVTYGFVEKEYRENNPIPENEKLQVQIDSIIGNASPEAYKYGDESLIPGNKETENLNLAKKHRAEDGKERILMAFQEVIDNNTEFANQIDTSSIQIIGEEPQLLESELDMLDSLKTKLGYPTIVDMIKANDKGEITSPENKRIIDDLINSKRNIVVTFSIKGQKKNVYVIPILLPLLVLIPRIRRRKTTKPIPPIPPVPPKNNQYIPYQIKNEQFQKINNRPHSRKQPKDYRKDYYSAGGSKNHNRSGRKKG